MSMGTCFVKVTCWFVGGMVATALLAGQLLDRPPALALEQAVNHFYRDGDGVSRLAAGWLLETGLVRDWAQPVAPASEPAPFPLLLLAANPQNTYPYQTYGDSGRPDGLVPGPFVPPGNSRTVEVDSVAQIFSAIRDALPGDIITVAPGIYDISAYSIAVQTPGSAARPIYLRAETYGAVLFHLDAHEGFHVSAPFWVFENLGIRGRCSSDSYCEHAFHIVGRGQSFTLRNSELVGFNAPIKVNLQPGPDGDYYPDNGLLEYNSFYNLAARATDSPVTLLNIDAADGWVVRGNYIADFAKNGGDHTSYAAFMKGNGSGGIFERNLVICEHRLPPDEGIRVGLSFGGGGSGARFCRQRNCPVEFSDGTIRNNIIMNCSRDVGIYLNRAARSEVHHNLLYNNLGIDVRFESSSANITGNIISGRIAERDGGRAITAGNIVARDCLGSSRFDCEFNRAYRAPERADFRLTDPGDRGWLGTEQARLIEQDFCGRPLVAEVNAGPLQYAAGFDCLALPTDGKSRRTGASPPP